MDFTINLESKKKQIFTTKEKSYAPERKIFIIITIIFIEN